MTTLRAMDWASGLGNAFYAALFADPLLRDFYAGSGYANFGLWHADTRDVVTACDALVDRILAPVAGGVHRVLDVACGLGATTRRARTRLPGAEVIGAGISAEQIAAARLRAPDGRFVQMDATHLDIETGSLDVVMCVEAAFHFDTRADFLAEALRVLRPGGQLVLSDVLMARGTLLAPRANYLRDRAAYAQLLARTGFTDIAVADATAATWDGFRRHVSAFIARQPTLGALAMRDLYAANVVCAWAVRQCVIVSARRPPRE